ncbi:MAG: MoaD/ThiS family protein [Thermosphaera sp.]
MKMQIRIRVYGMLKELVGREELTVSLDSERIILISVIEKVLEQYPQLGEFIELVDDDVRVRGVSILLNGRHVMFLGGSKAVIHNNDVLDLIPPMRGG